MNPKRPFYSFQNLDEVEPLLEQARQKSVERNEAKGRLRAALTPEQLELVFAYYDLEYGRQWAYGAHTALRAIRTHHLAPHPEGPEAAEIARLRAEVERLKTALAQRPLEAPQPAPYVPTPLRRRVVKADELPTDSPADVAAVARRIEELVKRHGGKCQKSDVSAALPCDSRFLADAYKHLHLSNRVRVRGMRLELVV